MVQWRKKSIIHFVSGTFYILHFCLKNVITAVEEVMDSFIFHTIFPHLMAKYYIYFLPLSL